MNSRLFVAGPFLFGSLLALSASCGDDAGGGGTGGGGGEATTGTGAGSCTPSCAGKECGGDLCDGSCGTCSADQSCNDGSCVDFCGSSCAGDCGPCPSNSEQTLTCTQSGICKCDASCAPECSGKDCGDDGCGGICGSTCGSGQVCTYDGAGAPEWTCQAFAGADSTMTFFVTSKGSGPAGGDLGGLDGADAFCQSLADAAGAGGKTWRAYLSAGSTAARDRIGKGPWFNSAGEAIVDEGCGDGCVDALHQSGIAPELARTELGTQVDWANAHDILTGSGSDGTPSGSDCQSWTSSDEFDSATVGHANESSSWGSSHDTKCDQVGMQCTAGQGHLYCFAE